MLHLDEKIYRSVVGVSQSLRKLCQLNTNNGVNLSQPGTLDDIHEIGHMLGFVDRYTDYVNATNPKDIRSLEHDGYQNDLMGSGAANLNQSHYDAVVNFTNFKLVQGQKHLLPEYRKNRTTLSGTVDGYQHSSVNPADVPAGFQPRGGVKKK